MSIPKTWVKTTLDFIRVDKKTSVNPLKNPDQKYELYSIPSHEFFKPEIVNGKEIGSSKISVEPETVLLGKINPRINRVWVVGKFTKHPKIASTEWIPFFPVEGIFPQYLSFNLQTNTVRDFLAHNVSGVGGSLMRIKPETLNGYPFPLPPLPEQHRIVAKIEELFSDLDAGVASLRKAKEQLKTYRQSVLKWAFEGKLTEEWRKKRLNLDSCDSYDGHDFKNQGNHVNHQNHSSDNLPEGWKWVILKDITSVISDGDHQPPPKSEKGIPFIIISNIKENEINFSNTHFVSESYYLNLKETRRPQKGDILYTVTGSYGIPVLVKNSNKFCFQRHIGLLRPANNINREFLFNVMCSKNVYNQATAVATGTAQLTVPLSGLRGIRIPLPPSFEEQSAIVSEIESRLSVADNLEKTIDTSLAQAEALRQSILKRAFEGKLFPQDPNDQPATELLKQIKADKEFAIKSAPKIKKRNRTRS